MLPDEQDGVGVTKPAYSQGGSVLGSGVPISTHPEADDIRPHSPSSRTATNSQKFRRGLPTIVGGHSPPYFTRERSGRAVSNLLQMESIP